MHAKQWCHPCPAWLWPLAWQSIFLKLQSWWLTIIGLIILQLQLVWGRVGGYLLATLELHILATFMLWQKCPRGELMLWLKLTTEKSSILQKWDKGLRVGCRIPPPFPGCLWQRMRVIFPRVFQYRKSNWPFNQDGRTAFYWLFGQVLFSSQKLVL